MAPINWLLPPPNFGTFDNQLTRGSAGFLQHMMVLGLSRHVVTSDAIYRLMPSMVLLHSGGGQTHILILWGTQ